MNRNCKIRIRIGMHRHSIKFLVALLAVNLFLLPAKLFAQSSFYQGKTMRLLIGSSSGGGYDLWARLLARFLGRHIPGNPDIIVQNMPGAASMIASNYTYNIAKPDGLTITSILPAIYFDQLVGRKEVKFDFAKFGWIGSPERNEIVHYMRADSPYQSIEAIRNAKEPPRCGSSGTGTTGHYIPRLLEEVLGAKHNIRLSAVIPAAAKSIWPWKRAKSIAGRRWLRPTSGGNLMSAGIKKDSSRWSCKAA